MVFQFRIYKNVEACKCGSDNLNCFMTTGVDNSYIRCNECGQHISHNNSVNLPDKWNKAQAKKHEINEVLILCDKLIEAVKRMK